MVYSFLRVKPVSCLTEGPGVGAALRGFCKFGPQHLNVAFLAFEKGCDSQK